jgi:hypothetical protein
LTKFNAFTDAFTGRRVWINMDQVVMVESHDERRDWSAIHLQGGGMKMVSQPSDKVVSDPAKPS